LFKQLLI